MNNQHHVNLSTALRPGDTVYLQRPEQSDLSSTFLVDSIGEDGVWLECQERTAIGQYVKGCAVRVIVRDKHQALTALSTVSDRKSERLTNLLLIEPPQSWQLLSNRAYARVATDINATIVKMDDGKEPNLRLIPAILLDLSAGGARIMSRVSIGIGTLIILQFCLEGDLAPVKVIGRVVRLITDRTSSTRSFEFGVEFLAVDNHIRARLNDYVLERVVRAAQTGPAA